jgi:hypothetical protein
MVPSERSKWVEEVGQKHSELFGTWRRGINSKSFGYSSNRAYYIIAPDSVDLVHRGIDTLIYTQIHMSFHTANHTLCHKGRYLNGTKQILLCPSYIARSRLLSALDNAEIPVIIQGIPRSEFRNQF